MKTARVVDLSTFFGRVVAALRQETGRSQSALAREMGWDRSLLSRIESGRNTATIDNVLQLELTFKAYGLLEEHGELLWLLSEVMRAGTDRGFVPVLGQMPKPHEGELAPVAALDRLVMVVLDEWLKDEEDL